MKPTARNPVTARTAHRGMALILGLLLLAAISAVAVMAANGMLLQRRMAANYEDRELALQNAGMATAAARAWLNSRADFEREPGCFESCLLPPAVHPAGELPERPEYESAAWWRLNGVPPETHPETGAATGRFETAPGTGRWLIEEVHMEPFAVATAGPEWGGIAYYRIFGRGVGRQAGSVAVTESLVARPWEGSYQPADYPPQADGPDFCRQFDAAVPCGALAWRQLR